MKQRIQWIVGFFTVASAGLALGCGCSQESLRLQPVREVIVQQQSTCAMESTTSPDWGAPFRTLGRVISAPFVALGGAFTPSDRYVEPVGERVRTYPGYYGRGCTCSRLMPVGERFSTVRIIRSEPMLEPVGERFVTVKTYHRPILTPVGERGFIVKHHHKKMLKPVGERTIIGKSYHKTTLKPVGEKKNW